MTDTVNVPREPTEAMIGNAIGTFMLNAPSSECVRQIYWAMIASAPKVEQEPVICHHEAYQGSCAHCGVKIVNGFAVRPKAHPTPSRELLAVAEAALEWIDAIPESVVTDHIPMPGLDRDWADNVIAKHKGPQS